MFLTTWFKSQIFPPKIHPNLFSLFYSRTSKKLVGGCDWDEILYIFVEFRRRKVELGATDHIARDRSLFVDFRRIPKGNRSIVMGNNATSEVLGI